MAPQPKIPILFSSKMPFWGDMMLPAWVRIKIPLKSAAGLGFFSASPEGSLQPHDPALLPTIIPTAPRCPPTLLDMPEANPTQPSIFLLKLSPPPRSTLASLMAPLLHCNKWLKTQLIAAQHRANMWNIEHLVHFSVRSDSDYDRV